MQPSVRAQTLWTPALLRAVLVQADGGTFRQLADLCDTLLSDDRIQTVAASRVGGLLGLPLSFEVGARRSKSSRPARALIRALEDDAEWFAMAPEAEQYQILTWAQTLGFCWAQKVYRQGRNGRLLPTLQFWHPRHVRYEHDTGRWFTRLADDGDREAEMREGDPQWFFYSPYGTFRSWANGLWRGLARWWLLKSYAIDDWGRHSEKAAQWVITTGMGVDPNLRKELASDISRLGRDAAVGLPPGFDVKLIEASANTRQIYEAQIEVANTGFAVTYLGQNLTTEVHGGSFAAAQVHDKGAGHRIRSDNESWSTACHNGLLRDWAALNYGDPELAPWPLRDTDEPEDEKARADVLVAITTAVKNAGDAGLQLDTEKLQDQFPGLPLAEGEDGKPLPIKKPKPPPAPKPQEPPKPEGDQQDQEQGGEAKPGEGEPAPKPGEAKPEKQAKALASGFDVRNASGFVAGQSYADALADYGPKRAVEALDPFLHDLLEWIDGVEDLETARTRLINFYRGALAPEELATKAERLFLLAQIAGVGAVRQDAPELKD